MKKFSVNVHCDMVISVDDIFAETEEEALRIAENKASCMDIATEGCCVGVTSCTTDEEECDPSDIESKIKEYLSSESNDCADIRGLGLCLGTDEDAIEDIELNHEDDEEAQDGGVILFHTEYGDTGSFDMLAKYQQEAILKYLQGYNY